MGGRVTTEQFVTNANTRTGGSKISDWKKRGKTLGWIHPKIGVWERSKHGMIPEEVEKDGEKEVWKRFFNCTGDETCVVCSLIKFADRQLESGADGDLVLLDGGKGMKLTIAEIAGKNPDASNAWKTDISAKPEFLIPWIAQDSERYEDKPVEVITAGKGLGSAVSLLIQRNIEDFGEDIGDPCNTPYPFRLDYNEKNPPAKKYAASKVDKSDLPMSDDVKEIMQADAEDVGIDMGKMVAAASPEKMFQAVASCWNEEAASLAEFEEFVGRRLQEVSDEHPDPSVEDPVDAPPDESNVDGVFATQGEKVKCPGCGVRCDAKAKYCLNCGNKIAKEEPSKVDSKKSPPKQAAKTPAKKDSPKGKADEPKKYSCKKCGNMVVPTKFRRCPKCSVKMENDVPFSKAN